MQLGWLLDCGKGKHYFLLVVVHVYAVWDFVHNSDCGIMSCGILACGILSVGFWTVGFWTMGFCPDATLYICEGYIILQAHSFMVYYHLNNCYFLNGKPTKSC